MKRKSPVISLTHTLRGQGSIMASWNLQCFLNQRLSLWLLTLVLAVIGLSSVTESVSLQGEVGQNVTFRCPSADRKIKFFYLQRGETFVNGYHTSKHIKEPIWENTRLDDNTTVHMSRLNVSHRGNYKCIIQYNDSDHVVENDIHLSVKANYNKPTVTMSCDKNPRFSCMVKCASQGGYPCIKMKWNVTVTGNTSSQIWKVLNSSEQTDPDTMLANSSSIAYFTCSYGVQMSFSCSVGNITSDMFSVCVPPNPSKPGSIMVIICAVVVVSFMVVSMVSVFLWRCKKGRQTSAVAGAVRPEEVIVLSGYTGGEEAS